jgi:filamentous hemagglutinin family protein
MQDTAQRPMGSEFAAMLTAAQLPGTRGSRSARKGRAVFLLATSALVGTGLAMSGATPAAYANPAGGEVVGGAATITQPNASTVNINQTTDRAAINWQSFSIDKGQTTQFVQPTASSVALNRVVGADPSVIAGTLKANGIVVLVNPSGIAFSQGSQVDVNGLVATVADIKNENFMAGSMKFDQASKNPNAGVSNQGTITVGQAGLAALVAPNVANSGVIQAKLGKVVLAGAETFTADLYGDGLVSFDVSSKVKEVPVTIDGKPATALVSNTGQITADGGHILLTADAVDGILTDLVDAGGTLKAQTAGKKTGTVEVTALGAGTVNLQGTVDISGLKAGETGGTAVVTGGTAALSSTAKINARASAGGGTVKIGGGPHGKDPAVRNATKTTVAADATIDASAVDKGNGGNVTVWSDGVTRFDGAITAKGGALGGDGGWVETSGHQLGIGDSARVDVGTSKGKAGTWLLDPKDLDIIASGANDNRVTATGVDVGDPNQNANITVSASALTALTGNLQIEASRDLTIDAALAFTQTSGTTIKFLAGRNLTVNQAVSTAGGALILSGAVATDGTTTFNNFDAAGTVAINAAVGSATTGNITLTAGTNGIALAGDLHTNASSTVTLTSTGAITQTAGVVTTNTLTGNSVGGASLNDANLVTNLGAFSNATAGAFSFTNAQSLSTTGTISNTVGALTLTTTTGNLSLGANVTGTGQTVTLSSAGSISQTGGAVAANTLAGSSAGDTTLTGSNAVTTLANFTSTGTGNFALNDTSGLTVSGALSASGNAYLESANAAGITIAATGSVAAGAAKSASLQTDTLTITAGGTISGGTFEFAPNTAGTAVTLGTGGTLVDRTGITAGSYRIGAVTVPGSGSTTTAGSITTLSAFDLANTNLELDATGAITATAGALTNVATLSGNAGTLADLSNTSNSVTTLSNFTAGTSLNFVNASALSAAGDTATSGALSLRTVTGDLTLTGAIGAGTTVTLTSSAGAISQTGGVITATTLTGSATTGVSLNDANLVTNLGSFSNTTTGAFSFTNNQSLSTTGTVSNTVGALSLVTTAGNLSLGADVNGTGQTVTLTSAGTIGQTAGVVTADTLTGSSVGDTSLLDANVITKLAAFTTTGSGKFSLKDTSALDVTGALSAADNSYLESSNAAGITVDTTGSVTAGAGKLASFQADTLTINAGGTISGGTFEYAPDTAGTAVTLGTGGTIADLTGITAGSYRIGAVTVPGSGSTTTAGSITTLSAFDLANTNLELDATGAITATVGALTNVATLSGSAGTSADLSNTSNSVTTLSNFTAGTSLNFVNTSALSAAGDTATSGTLSLRTVSGDLTLTGAIGAGTTVTLTSTAGAISQTGGVITATTLTGSSATTTSLADANVIANLGAFTTSGNFTLFNTATLTQTAGTTLDAGAGDIKIDNGAAAFTQSGTITTTANTATAVTVQNTGALSLNAVTSGSSGTVTLGAAGVTVGAITQASGGVITTGTLTGSSVGGATLDNANQVAHLGAFSNATSGTLMFTDNQSFDTTGIVSNTVAALNLKTTTGDITLGFNVTATGQTLTLTSAGAISQTGGVITAGTLTGSSTTTTSLTHANAITNLGTFTTSGAFSLDNTVTLTQTAGTILDAGAGDIAIDNGGAAFTQSGTITTTANSATAVTIENTAALSLKTITTGSAGTVTLGAAGLTVGAVTQASGGVITTGTLTGLSSSSVALTGANVIANLGAFTSSGNFTLDNTATLTQTAATTLDAGAGDIVIDNGGAAFTQSGTITTTSNTANAVKIQNTGALSIMTVTTGATGSVTLGATGATVGAITETAGGVITAGTLAGRSTGSVALTGANAISNLGAFIASGAFSLNNTVALTQTAGTMLDAGAGDVTIDNGGAAFTQSGAITTTSNSATAVTIEDTAALSVKTITTGSTGTVTLGAAGFTVGAITQASGGVITTGTLTGLSTSSVSLNRANAISKLGAFTSSGNFTLNNTTALTQTAATTLDAGAGDILIDNGGAAFTQSGTITTTSNTATAVTIQNVAALSVKTITTGATGTVTLNANGTITEASGGVITTGNLTGNSVGGTTLTGNNLITNLGEFDDTGASTTGFNLTNAQALTVTIGGGAMNVLSDNGPITLTVNGNLTLDHGAGLQALTSTVTLAVTGTISQDLGSKIRAATLTGSSVGGTNLIAGAFNLVDTLGPFTDTGAGSTGVTFYNAQALATAGTISSATGPISLKTTNGNLMLGGAVTASGNTVTLTSAGTITQTAGIITADTLTGSSVGGASLTDVNLVTNLGTFTNTTSGDLAFTDGNQGLTVTGDVTNNAGNITLIDQNAGGITVNAGNTISTTATAGVIDVKSDALSIAGKVVAAGTSGAVVIESNTAGLAIDVGTSTAGGNLVLDATSFANIATPILVVGDMTAGTVTVNTALSPTAFSAGATPPGTSSGITNIQLLSGAGNIQLSSGIALTGSGTLSMRTNGTITQSSGAIVAGNLYARAGGNISLASATNDVTTLAANAAGGSLSYVDANGFTVGSVTVSSPLLSATLTGVTTSGAGAADHDIGLIATTGSLTLANSVDALGAGSVKGNVLLSATAGTIAASSGPGFVKANGLIIRADTIRLDQGNSVNTFAAAGTGSGGIAFNNVPALTVGSATVAAPGISGDTLSGVAAAGDTGIRSSSLLTLNADVNVGSHNLYLQSGGNGVQQSSGAITANGLIVTGVANSSYLTSATNDVTTLAVNIVSGSFSYRDANDFVVGSVTVAPPALGATFTGVTTRGNSGGTPNTASNHDIALASVAGSIILTNNVDALGTGSLKGNVVLSATAGAVSEPEPPTAGGIITASGLIVRAATVDLEQNNVVDVLAASGSGAAGIAFNNNQALTLDSVTVTTPAATDTLAGIAAGGDVVLKAAGTLTLNADLNAGANDILLQTTTGDVIEPEPGPPGNLVHGLITAASLAVSSAGKIDLEQANLVGTLAGTAGSGGIAFNDAQSLTIGSVTTAAPSLNVTGFAGLTATSADAVVKVAGTLTVASAVSANNLLLSSTGSASGLASGFITASGFSLQASGDATVSGGFTTIAANIANGGFSYTGATGFTVGTVTTAAPSLNLTPALSGVTTSGATGTDHDIGLVATTGSIMLASNVDVQGAGSVRGNALLSATAGTVSQTTGIVKASGLIVRAGTIDLSQNNLVNILAVNGTGAAGTTFNDNQALTIDSVTVAAAGVNDTLTNVTGAGDAVLKSAGTLTLNADVNIGAHNLLLTTTTGNIVEPEPGSSGNPTHGVIIASGLALDSAGIIDLEQANQVTTLGAAASGGIAFNDTLALTVGSVLTSAPSLNQSVTGLSVGATGDVALKTAGALTLSANVNVGANNLLLQSTGAGITQTSGFVIANSLELLAATNSSLASSGSNNVTTLAVSVTAGGFAYRDANNFSVGSVTVTPPSLGATLAGVTTAGAGTSDHDLALISGTGSISLLNNVDAQGAGSIKGNVLLSATAGTVSEPEPPTAGGIIKAAGVIVRAATIDLEQNNLVDSLSANGTGTAGIAFNDTQALGIGSVTVTAPGTASDTLTGIAAAGDTALKATGAVTLGATLNVGAKNLSLTSTGAGITQTSGSILSNGLLVSAATNTALASTTNDITTLATSVTAGGLTYVDANSFAVGSITVTPPSLGGSLSGVTTAGASAVDHDIALVATTGSLSLLNSVDAQGAGAVKGNVLLSALAGTVSEPEPPTGGGIVKANGLIVRAVTIDLEQNSLVNVLSANGSGGAGIAFNDSQSLSVDSVTVSAPGFAVDTLAGVSGAGDTALKVAGSLTLNTNVTVGANNLLLQATGAVRQTGGAITASGLIVTGSGDSVLNGATNDTAILAASITGGGFVYRDANGFTAGSVTVAPPSLGASLSQVTTTGASAADHDIALIAGNGGGSIAANTLTLSKDVNANGADVLLVTQTGGNPGGDIVEAHPTGSPLAFTGGRILGNDLIVRSAGLIDLEQLNLVNQLGAGAAGGIAFRNNGALSLGGVTGTSDVSVSAPSGTTATITDTLNTVTAGSDLGIEAVSGGITLLNNVSASNIRLAGVDATGAATGAINQTAGAITTTGLIVIGSGNSALNSGTNDAATLAASITSGGFTYRDANDLAVGAVTVTPPSLGGSLSAVITTGSSVGNHDIALTSVAGSISLFNNVDSQGSGPARSNVLLSAIAGTVSEPEPPTAGGIVKADGLIVQAVKIDLEQNNLINSLAATETGAAGIAFNDAQGLKIDTVTVAAPGVGPTTLSSTTAAGDVALDAVGGLTLNIDVNVGGHNLLLLTTGPVSQTGGAITSGGLAAQATASSDLTSVTNNISTLAASVTGGGLTYRDANDFAVGTVAVTPPSLAGTLVGVTTRGAGGSDHDIGLISAAGSISLRENVDAQGLGSVKGNVLLSAVAGTVSEPEPPTAGGIITANGLIVRAATIDLEQNNLVDALSINTTGALGVAFNDSLALAVNTVTVAAPGIASDTLASSTTAGDTALKVGGTLSLATSLNAGAHNLLLQSTTSVTQTGGSITAGGLMVVAAANTALTGAGNDIATLTANVTGGSFSYRDATGFTVGSVTVASPSLGGSLSGVTTNGATGTDHDIGLVATTGSITLASNVDAQGAGSVRGNALLSATAGTVSETTGIVKANGLIVRAGTIDLSQNNLVNILAVNGTGAAGTSFNDNQALTIDSVTVAAPGISSDTLTDVTGAGDAVLKSAGTLTLNADVNIGAHNLLLLTTTGDIVEPEPGSSGNPSHGVIVASGLALNSAGIIDLEQANQVTTLGATASGGIAFNDILALTVGSVLTAPSLSQSVTGLSVGGTGDVALKTAGALTLAASINVGTNKLLLQSTGAGITQTSGSVIASGLELVATTNSSLASGGNNNVSTLAANITGGGLAYRDQNDFTVGTVTVTPPSLGATQVGVTTAGSSATDHDLALIAGVGSISLLNNVDTQGAGSVKGNVLLTALAGTVSEPEPPAAGGIIKAAGLTVRAVTIDLEQNNLVDTFSASGTGAAGIAFNDNQALSVGTVTVATPGIASDTMTGVIAGGDTTLKATGTVTLNGNIALEASNLLLQSTTAGISQASGSVVAGGLEVRAIANSVLTSANNDIATLASNVTAGGFTYRDLNDFTVGSVTVASPSLGAAQVGVTTAGGSTADHDIGLISVGGAIGLNNNVDAQGAGSVKGNVLLSAVAGKVSEPEPPIAGGIVKAAGLIVRAATIDLEQNNLVDTLSMNSTGAAGIAFNDNQVLAIGSVTVAAPGIAADTLASVTAAGDTALKATGALSLNGNIVTGARNLLLQSTTAGVTQTSGAITANGLVISVATSAMLPSITNDVVSLTANASTGSLIYDDANGFTVGPVTVKSPSLGVTSTGIGARSDVTLIGSGSGAAGSVVTIASGINSAAGNVTVQNLPGRVMTTGDITLGAGGYIFVGATSILQTGSLALNRSSLNILDTTGSFVPAAFDPQADLSAYIMKLPLASPGTAMTFDNLTVQGSLVLIESGAKLTGKVAINGKFGIVSNGTGSSDLTGSIQNVFGQAAAQFGRISVSGTIAPSNDFKFNNCATGSATCVVVPTFVPVEPQTVETLDLSQQQRAFDDIDVERLDTGKEDLYCEGSGGSSDCSSAAAGRGH